MYAKATVVYDDGITKVFTTENYNDYVDVIMVVLGMIWKKEMQSDVLTPRGIDIKVYFH